MHTLHTYSTKLAVCTTLIAVGIIITSLFVTNTTWASITPISSSSSGAITITNAEKGVDASAYKVLIANFDDTAQQPKDPVYTWAEETQNWITTNYPSYISSDGTVESTFYGITDAEAATFYQEFAAAIKGGTITLTASATTTADTDGEIAFSNLAIGSYLVVIENGLYVYSPLLLNIVPTWDSSTKSWIIADDDITAKVKAETLSITKGVATSSDATTSNAVSTSIGSTLYYTISADVPTYPAGAYATAFKIGDVLSSGLTLNTSSIMVYGYLGTAKTVLTENSAYTLTTSNAVLSDNTALSFLLTFDYSAIEAYDTIVVTYNATVNNNATAGTSLANHAFLEYSNNPYDTSSYKIAGASDDSSITEAYVYGFELTKVDADDANTLLSGAQFNLADSDNTTLSFVQTAEATYRLAGISDTETTTTLIASAGTLNVYGLNVGSYTLTETKAPDEYALPADSYNFTITDNDVDGAPCLNSETNEYETGLVTFTITNTHSALFTLPKTGSTATIGLAAAGIALISAAGITYALRKKQARNSSVNTDQ